VVLRVVMSWGEGSLGKVCAITFGGRIVRKIVHVNMKIINQGAGFNWGISLRVVGGHLVPA